MTDYEKIEKTIYALQTWNINANENFTWQEMIEYRRFAIKCIEEVEQYRALGTVEELKEAREKQVAKEPIPNCSFFKCPSCESFDIENFNDSGGSTKNKFCPDCGQA